MKIDYEFYETKPKIHWSRILYITLIILMIIWGGILGIYHFNTKKIENRQQNEKIGIHNTQRKYDINGIMELAKKEGLPVLSEQAKNDIKNIYKSDTKRIFLTFDDGPSQKVTIPILDILKQNNIKATFFVLGSRVEVNPDIAKREYEEGHYIANHGYSHVYQSIYTSPQTVLDEYNQTENTIKNAIGQPNYSSNLFRFPGGSHGGKYAEIKEQAIGLLEQNNIAFVNWNALTGDAEGKNTKEEMIEDFKATVGSKNSVVVLMHDAGAKATTVEALPDIINYAKEQGYEFKSFYDIMK